MITPRFRLYQAEDTFSITIRAPYCSLKDLDVSVDENVYVFFCKPYYLRLTLPGHIIENEHSKSSFDTDNGEFSFTYEKVTPGEDFPNLDYITRFLCSKIDVTEGNRKIEILTSENGEEPPSSEVVETKEQYGFAMRGGYEFKLVSTEFNDIFEIDPHVIALEDRRKLRMQNEEEKFGGEHYLGDLVDDEELPEFRNLKSPYEGLEKEHLTFSPKELDFLKDLPNIEYNLTPQQVQFCHNSLIDILFAYCYDRRTTHFEGTCESGWTISKLSASLSWFEGFSSPKDALISAFRRSLIYPLYREFLLAQSVLNDLRMLLKLGEKMIIKSLLKLHDIFVGGDCGSYILNNLFIKDYIIYVMKWDKDLWLKTLDEVLSVQIDKIDLGLNLVELETSLHDDMIHKLQYLNLDATELDSDDCSYSASDDESSGCCESCSDEN